MDRITGATTDIGSGRRGFRDRNLGLSQAGTIPGATWFNGAQEEIVRTIELLGLTPTDANSEQLIQALRRLSGGNVTTLSATTTLTADHAGMVLMSASGGPRTLTLPAANAAGGVPLRLNIIRTDTSANVLTIQRAGSDLIEGATSRVIPAGGRLVLISNGVSNWYALGDAGRLLNIQVFTSTGTYTPTPGTVSVEVEAVGGGGAGGGGFATSNSSHSVASGGAAGSPGRGRYLSGFAGVTVTIGAGGASNAGAAGGAGGTTSFGSLLTCPGGGGGGTATTSVGGNAVSAQGGPGAASSGGLFPMSGQPGFCGLIAPSMIISGQGASSIYGGGGLNTSGGLGGNGNAHGAGGGGSANNVSVGNTGGGLGAAGIVIVKEYS